MRHITDCFLTRCLVYWWPLPIEGKERRKLGLNMSCVDDVEALKWVDRRTTYEDARAVLEGIYDERGRIEPGRK